ncbi:MAG: glycosyltransferase family 2 protein [Alphaproteobacteria bacterium]
MEGFAHVMFGPPSSSGAWGCARASTCAASRGEPHARATPATRASRSDIPPHRKEDIVTVIVPAYNAARTLEATLSSVRNQTHGALEILVVDDGSTDATPEIARRAAHADPRVRLIRQPNRGVAAARNAGLVEAWGAYVAPVDADDLWHPRKIELQLDAARRVGEALAFVYAWSRRIDEADVVLADLGPVRWRGDVFPMLAVSNFLRNASNALIPTEPLRALGGFDPMLRAAGAQGAEDLKVLLALARRGFVEVVPAYLVGYRASSRTMSGSAQTMRRSIELVLAETAEGDCRLPAQALHVATVNYDLYAADRALNSRDLRRFANFLFKALRRDPILAVRLGLAAAWDRISYRSSRAGACRFLDLDPESPLIAGRTLNLVDDVLERALARAVPPQDARNGGKQCKHRSKNP